MSQTRLRDCDSAALETGQILVKVDRFALTANNITYGVVGGKIGYWQFFPVDDQWGIIPVWGFADVVESRHVQLEEGERLYGYFPIATHLRMQPDKLSDQRLIDAAPHRAGLPAVYNAYARTAREPCYDASMDDERMLLFPLYATSYCIYDFLADKDNFGAEQVVILSASSKTAIGLAYAFDRDPAAPLLTGLTSARNLKTVTELGLYSRVFSYEEVAKTDASTPTVVIDMSGNGRLLSELHAHLGGNMRFTSNVGLTHYQANDMGPDFIRDRSATFFAPAHIKKRAGDWGPGVFEKKAMAFWRDAAVKSRRWLRIERSQGLEGAARAYREVLSGGTPPTKGIVVAL